MFDPLHLLAANAITNIGQGIVALLPPILIPIGIYKSVQWAFAARAGLGKLTGNLQARTQSISNKAKERAESSNFFQTRQMARDARKQERRRGNITAYANKVTGTGLSSAMMRRRAGGIGNDAGQQRAYVAGLSALEKQEHEEMQQASAVLDANRITNPTQFRAIAEGRTGTGVTGSTVSGAGNTAMRQAAIQKLIDAQDARELEGLFQNLTSVEDQQMLVSLLQKSSNYSTAKGAGAHLVSMGAQAGGYTQNQVQDQALAALGKLSAAKLAAQDGPAVQSAVESFMRGGGTIDQRRDFYDLVQQVYSNSQMHDTAKGSARSGDSTLGLRGMDTMFTFDPSTGSATPNVARP